MRDKDKKTLIKVARPNQSHTAQFLHFTIKYSVAKACLIKATDSHLMYIFPFPRHGVAGSFILNFTTLTDAPTPPNNLS